MANYPNGSAFRKWDLHVHSPASHLNNQFPSDWDGYVKGLFKAAIDKDIAALGITDYFTIDGYKKVRQEYLDNPAKMQSLFTAEEIEKIKNILVIPNIEFRLNKFVGESSINFHVLFAEDVPIQFIEENFLHDLDFVYEGNPQSAEEKWKLKVANVAALGAKLRAEHQEFQRYSDIHAGMMNAVVDDAQISKVLEGAPSKFKGKYLMGVVADEDLSDIDWNSQDHQTRKVLIQKSDFLLSSNPKTRQWALGRPPYTSGEKKFIEEFKTLKPCLHGSDAHGLKFVGHPCIHRGEAGHDCAATGESPCELRNAWIKADPTFEGLKQLLYEPSERVAIQQDDPTPLKSKYTLARFRIGHSTIGTELSIEATDIPLNTGLVAVTGGKGGGKTAFVDLIANSYADRCRTKDPNSFVRRIADQSPTVETTLDFKDGSSFKKEMCDNTFFQDSDIVYVAQGELEKYIGDDSDLDIYVKSLVFESPQIKDTVKSFEFEQLAEAVAETRSALVNKSKLIVSLEQRTGKTVADAIELEVKQKGAELKDIEERIKELAKAQSADKIKLAQDKQKVISDLKAKRDDLTGLKNLLANALSFIDTDLKAFNESIVSINALLAKLGVAETVASITYGDRPKLNARATEVKVEINSVVKEIETAQKELTNFETGVKDHAKLLDKKAELVGAIATGNTRAEQLKKDEQALAIAVAERAAFYKQLLETVILQKRKYEEIIATFSSHKADVLSDLNFGVRVQFDFERFLQTAEDVMDNRKVEIAGKNSPSIFADFSTRIKEVIAGDEAKIPEVVAEVERSNQAYKDKLKNSKAISVADFYGFLYDDYFSVTPTVRYKNTSLSKLSLGQKATVLIKIYLAQGDKPIIIDSHDDHLDNEFIMDELVRAIRQAKTYRQVILASNNGNVVINSDAEQIIIANREHGEISYIAGSIENPTVRDRAIKVLEGGSDAFRQRQQKYRLA
jgi:hypothetical protein